MRTSAALRVLNAEPWSGDAPSDGAAVAERLQRATLTLLSEHLSADGSRVDYVAAARSDAFRAYAFAARELQLVEVRPAHALSRDTLTPPQLEAVGGVAERRCFLLNLYNSLTVHGLLDAAERGGALPSSPQKLPDFWNATAVRLGRWTLTLNDVEHGLLRGNGVQPLSRSRHWAASDPRAALALPLDPRVHFALNCGARSCPPVRLFTPANVEYGLEAAAGSFLEASMAVEGDTVTLSSLLLWYGVDFGPSQRAVLQRVAGLMRPESGTRARLEALLERSAGQAVGPLTALCNAAQAALLPALCLRGPVDVRWAPYDWATNAADGEGGAA